MAVGIWGHIASYTSPPHPLDAALERWQLRHADHVFAYTPSGANLAHEWGADSEKITAVHNTIDSEVLRSDIEGISDQQAREWRGVQSIPDKPFFALVGGLDESKKIKLLSDALDYLWLNGHPVHLVVGGSGVDATMLEKAVNRGQVTMLGRVGGLNKAHLLRGCIAIVNPGRVGLIAVDALTANRPILTTRWRYHAPEIEYLSEQDSVWYSDDDAQSFANLMLACGAGSLGEMSPRNAPSLENMAENFSAGIRSMLKRRDRQ